MFFRKGGLDACLGASGRRGGLGLKISCVAVRGPVTRGAIRVSPVAGYDVKFSVIPSPRRVFGSRPEGSGGG